MKNLFGILKFSFLFLFILGLVYLFLSPFDYKISFESKNAPWLFYHISKLDNYKSEVIQEKKNTLFFNSFPSEKSNHYLAWELESINEKLTEIDVKIHIIDNPLSEKLKIIIGRSSIVSSTLDYLKTLKANMVKEESEFGWDRLEENHLNAATCLCVSVKEKISEKANEMNKNIDYLASYLPIGKKDPPRLYINSINLHQQMINFDLCFKIPENYILPALKSSDIFVKKQPMIKGLSQTFYGNYSQSHRGWFKVIQKLNHQGEKINIPAVEVFYDSPFSFKPEEKWKSILYFSTSQLN